MTDLAPDTSVNLPASSPAAPYPTPAAAKPRLEWVDSAKAVSIFMVVLWHAFQRSIDVNELLIFTRMPLFFFVAGFFSVKALQRPWKDIFVSKTGHFLYLYGLWLTAFFILVIIPASIKDATPIEWMYVFKNFIDPTSGLWFLYALAIIFPLAKMFSRVPPLPLFAMLIVLYVACTWDGQWWAVPFPERFPRLTLFFALGAWCFPWLRGIDTRYDKWFPVAAAGYFLLAYSILSYTLGWIAPLTLLASVLGLATILLFSRFVQGSRAGDTLNFIGKRTLHIYVMHRIMIFYANGLLPDPIKAQPLLRDTILALVSIVLSIVAGLILERISPLFFEAPWVRKTPTRPNAIA